MILAIKSRKMYTAFFVCKYLSEKIPEDKKMYIIFVILWIIFNGKFTWEILWIGAVISAMLYWFVCRFMGYSIKKDLRAFAKIGQAVGY